MLDFSDFAVEAQPPELVCLQAAAKLSRPKVAEGVEPGHCVGRDPSGKKSVPVLTGIVAFGILVVVGVGEAILEGG